AGMQIAAAREDDRLTVGRERQLADVDAVVRVVLRELPRLELRRVGRPDVSDALGVRHPCEAPASRRRNEVGGERRAENGLERELRGVGGGGDEQQRGETLHAFAAMLVTLPFRSPITQLP